MEVKEFQRLALRTESKVDKVEVNTELLKSTLALIATLNQILDGLKKSIYYNDDKKLESFKQSTLLQPMILAGIGKLLDELDDYDNKEVLDTNSRVLHGIVGMSTESGELLEALMNSLQDNKPIDATNVSEEMHDSSWYMAIVHDELELIWTEGLANLIAKLKIRFPDKFTNENAGSRDLKAERLALEGKRD